ncbi:MAG: hypothetical protein PWR06_218 [Thermoanaerobacteraceae bacterium]|jgi:hypothetical protein|nr:hypothetical protein [Biomaibacter acetigenes]MDK2877502.1 hypothetical protein [Thermoanaerobacteraceae bacterium]MDN5312016.1 hypothetical protein [Thermoanaerobacteraceae bacterium]
MSMRPIDLQVIMPKTAEATKVQQVIKDSNEAHQSLLSAQFKEQLKSAREKVYERAKPEEIKVEGDKDNNKKEKGKNKQGNNKKKGAPKNSNHIDVRI